MECQHKWVKKIKLRQRVHQRPPHWWGWERAREKKSKSDVLAVVSLGADAGLMSATRRHNSVAEDAAKAVASKAMAKALSAPNHKKSAWPKTQRLCKVAGQEHKLSLSKGQVPHPSSSAQNSVCSTELQRQSWAEQKSSHWTAAHKGTIYHRFIIGLASAFYRCLINPIDIATANNTDRQQTSRPLLPASKKTSWLVCKCLRVWSREREKERERETGRVSPEWLSERLSKWTGWSGAP